MIEPVAFDPREGEGRKKIATSRDTGIEEKTIGADSVHEKRRHRVRDSRYHYSSRETSFPGLIELDSTIPFKNVLNTLHSYFS